ncbi:MAG: hypothetical protein M1511_19385 [Deltaproteobacteria bacterium]|nr:hypothetical protein [Deltaproteobacteria bacterium]
MISNGNGLTPEQLFFLSPEKPLHRQYEALRAYFVEKLPSDQVAERFGYSPGAFRVLCSEFRHNQERQGRFFKDVQRGPHTAPKRDPIRELVISLRKQNLSIYDIQRELDERGTEISVNALSILLREEGFARLPRRRDDERPDTKRTDDAPVADVRKFDLSPRKFRTAFAGLFLFIPLLCEIDLQGVVESASLPGSGMIPAAQAVRALLALKLLGKERTSHVMEMVFDPGIALFAGLNVVPKRSFLSTYSARVDPRTNFLLMSKWSEAIQAAGFRHGSSFDLDFHSIPANSQAEPLDKHYVSSRSRSQKGILTFLARDVQENVMCYGNAGVPKPERDDEILRFAEYWKGRTGHYPRELVFDSQLTTYSNLQKLNECGISFITLRRRTKKMIADIYATPPSQWQRVNLPALTRQYRNPRVLESTVQLKDYNGSLRQLAITDLGHEEPTLLLTNQLNASIVQLITRYAQRMLIENGIADAINFFHIDSLSSMVGLKVDFDLQLTLMAASLYRIMAQRIGREYRRATAKTLFRKLFDVSGQVILTDSEITVELTRRAHNPLLVDAGLTDRTVIVPWLHGKPLHISLD